MRPVLAPRGARKDQLAAAFASAALSLAALEAGAAKSNEFLSVAQKKSVLRSIDNVCADTWCSGDFNFRFNQIFCSTRTKSCRVVFQYFPHGEPAKTKNAACDIKGVNHYIHLIDTKTRGRELIQRVYDQLNVCVSRFG